MIVMLSAAGGPAPADTAAVARPTFKRAWTARVVYPTVVRARPSETGRRMGRLATTARWNGGVVRLLVLAVRHDAGKTWLRVRLPDRPNGSSGWIDADFAQLAQVHWRVVIDRRARRARAYFDGRLKRSWRVVVGKASTPTPRGLFAVYERVRQPPGAVLGPYALHLTANSNVLFDYGGGPGRIALHGRSGALLGDPLGSARSHGCIRMDNAVIRWLAARAGPGTPVVVR